MALIVADRVWETCTSPGIGVVTLLGALPQYRTFSSTVGNANTTPYVIADITGINWEVGIATYATSGNTLTRGATPLSSSNGGALVNFSSGSQNVWLDYPAGYAVYANNNSSQTLGQALISGGVGVSPAWGNIVTSFSGNTTGLTPSTPTTGAITLGGTLAVANGGTNASTASITSFNNITGYTASGATGTTSTNLVFSTSPTLVTPALGTPSALVGTNITGTATAFTASNVTTNANLTGMVTSVGNATTVVTNANLTGAVTSVGNASSLGSFTSAQLATALTDETGTGSAVFAISPTLVTPALGVATATSLTATGVVTGAELIASNGLVLNNKVVATTYTLPTGYNASSVGPVTINSGVIITVPSTQRWVVL